MAYRAIIVGGGIAGLTAAIALERVGVSSEIFEAAPQLEPVGAGIWMAPNAMQVFARLGIARDIERAGKPLSFVRICDHSFQPIQVTDLTPFVEEFGFGITAIHRGRLQEILLSKLKSTKVNCGCALDSLESSDSRVTARFRNGREADGDLLIGSDGIHSRTRKILFGDKPLRFSGLTCWRGVTNISLNSSMKAASFELWGGRNRFGFSEIGEDLVYWYAASKSEAGKPESRETLQANLLNRFRAFASPVCELIESTDSKKIIQTDLYDLPPFNPWARGNIGLIGDAAHPMTPNLGQGGAQAVVDAYLLSQELSRSLDISVALRSFEQRRFKKVKKVVNGAFFFGKLAHLESGAGLRNFALRKIPGSINLNQMREIFRIE